MGQPRWVVVLTPILFVSLLSNAIYMDLHTALQLTVPGMLGIVAAAAGALVPLYILGLKMYREMATNEDVAAVREKVENLRELTIENRMRSESNQRHIHDRVNEADNNTLGPTDDSDNQLNDGGGTTVDCPGPHCPFDNGTTGTKWLGEERGSRSEDSFADAEGDTSTDTAE